MLARLLQRVAVNTRNSPRVETDQEIRDRAGGLLVSGEAAKALALFRDVYERNRTGDAARIYVGEYATALVAAGALDELRAVARATNFRIFDPMRSVFLHDLDDLERMIFLEVCNHSCQTPEAVASLSRAVKYVVEQDVPGDFVECGVFLGASIVCIIRTLQSLGVSDRDIWLYDTFEGMPEPEAIDQFYVTSEKEDGGLKSWELHKRDDGSGGSNWVWGPMEAVRKNVLATGYPEERIHFVKGKVEDTVPAQSPERISLLRLDTDFYSSTKHEFDHLYPRASVGAPVIIDDYGAYQGVEKGDGRFHRRAQQADFPVTDRRTRAAFLQALRVAARGGETKTRGASSWLARPAAHRRRSPHEPPTGSSCRRWQAIPQDGAQSAPSLAPALRNFCGSTGSSLMRVS